MNLRLFAAPLALAALLPAGAARASDWEIDAAHTTVQFSVRHMMVTTVRGQFEKVAGTVILDDKDAAKSKIEIVIETASIDTRNAKRDEHLRSADFFDAGKNPQITFRATKVAKAGAGKYKVTGDLTMRGVTKPVTLDVTGPSAPAKSPWGTSVRGVAASGKINRKDWGLDWNKPLEAGGVLVGDEVELRIDAELIEKAPAKAAANP